MYNIFNPLASKKHYYIVSALAVEAKNKKTTYYQQEPTIQFWKTITLHILINLCQIFSASSEENYVYLIALHVYAFGCSSLLCNCKSTDFSHICQGGTKLLEDCEKRLLVQRNNTTKRKLQ